jgi:hypothetical protein
MIKLNIVAMIFIIGISVVFMSCSIIPIRGNGNLVSFERTFSPFEKINSGGSAEIRFHKSQEYRAVITVDSNLEKYVKIETKNNVLNIGIKTGLPSFTKYLIDIYCPVLTGVSISGSGCFIGDDKIVVSTFEANVSGSGNINGIIECENYSANISGSGEINTNIICNILSVVISGSGVITITGTGNDSSIRISGSGNFNGIEFKTNNVTTHISGSGNMYIWVLENINATVAGSGNIIYRGAPKINFNGSGSGRIRSE